jgi:nucleotide-binding universal stress UspA family protein
MVDGLGGIVLFLGIILLCSFGDIDRKGIKTILVPTDFSESSDVALQIAIDLAKQQSAKIYLLHVLRFRGSGSEIGMMERQIAKFPEAKCLEVNLDVRTGRVYEEILKEQAEKNLDLIVIARHRKAEHSHALFGNVAAKVKRKAQCSVLLVGA